MMTDPTRPRVLVLGPRPPAVGGIASVMTQQMRGPLAAYADLHCMADNPPWMRRWGILGAALRHLALVCTLAFRLIRERIDILHRHTSSFRTFDRSVIDVLTARLLRRHVVLHMHGGRFLDDYRSRSPHGRFWLRLGLRLPHAVVVLHDAQRGRVESLSGRATCVIPNGVALPAAREPLRAGNDVCRILYVGELSIAKGLPELLCAVAELRQSTTTPFRLRLAGALAPDIPPESLRMQLRRLQIESVVEPLGALDAAVLPDCYRAADMLVLASRAEAMPMCVLEAMSHGLPVVATAVGALPEMLADGGGTLVTVGDVRGLAQALRTWIVNPRARRAAGAAARRRVEREYGLDQFARRLAALYQGLLAPDRGARESCTSPAEEWGTLPTRRMQELPTG